MEVDKLVRGNNVKLTEWGKIKLFTFQRVTWSPCSFGGFSLTSALTAALISIGFILSHGWDHVLVFFVFLSTQQQAVSSLGAESVFSALESNIWSEHSNFLIKKHLWQVSSYSAKKKNCGINGYRCFAGWVGKRGVCSPPRQLCAIYPSPRSSSHADTPTRDRALPHFVEEGKKLEMKVPHWHWAQVAEAGFRRQPIQCHSPSSQDQVELGRKRKRDLWGPGGDLTGTHRRLKVWSNWRPTGY